MFLFVLHLRDLNHTNIEKDVESNSIGQILNGTIKSRIFDFPREINSSNKIRLQNNPLPANVAFTCYNDTSYNPSVPIPNEYRLSTLADPLPCNGSCVAFCVVGGLRSFFDYRIWTSQRDILINNGFGRNGRNDVYFVNSNSRGTVNDETYIATSEEEQCAAWNEFNIVSEIAHIEAGDQKSKIKACVKTAMQMEKKYGQKYDWIVRTRPDLRWRSMELDARTASQSEIKYRISTFAICPRGLVEDGNYCR
mmetsp:Transcript_16913/g.23363  ORF Transcript_16913/g.23363 Transcript_16913/m.23363 type:complete len:251 (+) Transcript_16913:251-1003(+)